MQRLLAAIAERPQVVGDRPQTAGREPHEQLLRSVALVERTIPQRELRNNIGAILRAAEAGQTFTVTVRGRPVARVVPAVSVGEPRTDVDRATLRRILAQPLDDRLETELATIEAPLNDPWPPE